MLFIGLITFGGSGGGIIEKSCILRPTFMLRTRQGNIYSRRDTEDSGVESDIEMDAHELAGSGKQGGLGEQGVEELLEMLLEDRRTWEREATEKAKEREEQTHLTCTIDHEQQVRMMQAQIEAMQHWMECS